jgi:hypothetical protein
MKRSNGGSEDPMSNDEDRSLVSRRERAPLPPRQAELPRAGLGEVARDVVDHAQVIARDALAIARLEARRAVGRATGRAKEAAPRIAFGAIAGVSALVGTVFLLIAIFIALGDPIPSVGWRLSIFGLFFVVVAVIAAIFAGSHEERHEEDALRGFDETPRRGGAEGVRSSASPERTPSLPAARH